MTQSDPRYEPEYRSPNKPQNSIFFLSPPGNEKLDKHPKQTTGKMRNWNNKNFIP